MQLKINNNITLKLEKSKTIIYIKEKKFIQCKYVLLINPNQDERQWSINSIDEAKDSLNQDFEYKNQKLKYKITKEEEFWVHCSNIQTWIENDYDTKILHSNIAFPLLKELVKIGDHLANKIFKEEIAKRFESCYIPTMFYLIKESYLDFLLDDEIDILLSNIKNKDKNIYDFILPLIINQGYKKGNLIKRYIENNKNINQKFKEEIEFGKYDNLYLGERLSRQLRIIITKNI